MLLLIPSSGVTGTPGKSPQSRLILAEVLWKQAVAFMEESGSTGNISLLRQAGRFAAKASSLNASVLSGIVAAHADRLTGQARADDEGEVLSEALKYSKDAAALSAKLVSGRNALDKTELAQYAFDSASSLKNVIKRIQATAQNMIQTTEKVKFVEIAKTILKELEPIEALNAKTIKSAYEAGAIPQALEAYEPPDEDIYLPFKEPSWPPVSPASPI